MRHIAFGIAITSFLTLFSITATAQVASGSDVRRKKQTESTGRDAKKPTQRLAAATPHRNVPESEIEWQKVIYRELDLTKGSNAALFYPEDPIDGRENLFRVLLNAVASGSLPAYEYLDGREVFTPEYRIKPLDMLERFEIPVSRMRGTSAEIAESDVPASQVLKYYIVESWQFDNIANEMQTKVEAICPVLDRTGDYGETMHYPMFWVKMEDAAPLLATRFIMTDDDKNMPRYSMSDFFNLRLYKGEIYKTRNMRNLSMQELFPDEDDRKAAQDSIENRLSKYAEGRWLPTREEYLAAQKGEKDVDKGNNEIPERTIVESSTKQKKALSKRSRRRRAQVAASNPDEVNSRAERSVKRRKK